MYKTFDFTSIFYKLKLRCRHIGTSYNIHTQLNCVHNIVTKNMTLVTRQPGKGDKIQIINKYYSVQSLFCTIYTF